MYSSERIKAASTSKSKFMDAGIHENVKLVSYRFDKSPVGGNKFLEFTFEKDGQVMIHTEWEPKIGLNLDGSRTQEQLEEALQSKQDTLGLRMFQILSCYYPNEEDRNFVGETFSDFAKWIVEMLDKADTEQLLRIKVVFNRKGWLSLPNYGKIKFIEPMSIPTEESKIRIIDNIDLITRPVIADTEVSNPNPLTTEFAAVNTTLDKTAELNDLPF